METLKKVSLGHVFLEKCYKKDLGKGVNVNNQTKFQQSINLLIKLKNYIFSLEGVLEQYRKTDLASDLSRILPVRTIFSKILIFILE